MSAIKRIITAVQEAPTYSAAIDGVRGEYPHLSPHMARGFVQSAVAEGWGDHLAEAA